jgi:hypothetical protein
VPPAGIERTHTVEVRDRRVVIRSARGPTALLGRSPGGHAGKSKRAVTARLEEAFDVALGARDADAAVAALLTL